MIQSKQQTVKDKHVIVISYDAFSVDNFEEAKRQPHLASLIRQGSSTTQLKSVYPTLTYIIHTSYITGVYPNKHGVYHNNPLQPFIPTDQQEWFWYRHNIKVPTIFEAVASAGLTSASLLWPVSGKAKITYNIPEIRAINRENQALKILKNGSPLYSMSMELKYGKLRKGIMQPYLDDFTTACAVDTIKRKKPNLLMVHLIDLDDIKHEKGTQGSHISDVIRRMDKRIGEIVEATKAAGTYDNTTFIVIGDHGQKDVHSKVHLNRLLMENGLIWEENGQWHWRAYIQGSGGSAYLHIKPNDTEALEQAKTLLHNCLHNKQYGIASLILREELDQLHVPDDIILMLEAMEGYCFEDEIDKPVIDTLSKRGEVFATHGYLPTLTNYTSNLIISGHGIKQGETFKGTSVIDLAPNLAALFNIPFGPCEGRVWDEVIM